MMIGFLVYINLLSREDRFIIDHVALAKQGGNALGSVRPSVCLFVLSQVNDWTFVLDFWHWGRP